MRVAGWLYLVAVSRFFQNLTQMNFAENKKMHARPCAHKSNCLHAVGYMRERKKKKKSYCETTL